MRLRLTVRRHGLPETSIIWVVDSSTSPTIAQLLEQVNDSIPIEAGEWGFEDYAVEVRGSNGLNYECLHYQPVLKVMKEEDEVIIRPLLTHDLRVRKISGRHQISADGKHLVDGLAYGRPLLRKPADRPSIKIPPRKRRRITYPEEEELEEEDLEAPEESFAALEDAEDSNSGDAKLQLVLHADFDDDSEEEDGDFAPGDDSAEEDNDSGEEMGDNDLEEELSSGDESAEETEATRQPELESQRQDGSASELNGDPLALADVSSEATRAQIFRLQSAFPKAALAVCKYTLLGTGLDMGEAYEALNRGFVAVKSKSAIIKSPRKTTDSSLLEPQVVGEQKSVLNLDDSEDEGGVEVEQEEDQDSVADFYDQNGFPPGSIVSGKLKKFPAVSPTGSLSSPASRTSPVNRKTSATSNEGRVLSQRPTSTPLVDQISTTDEDSDETSEDSTDEVDSSSDSDGSDSSEEAMPVAEASSESSSESDSDISTDSSSDEDGPEETSSKPTSAEAENHAAGQSYFLNHPDSQARNRQPGQGSAATRLRNERRKKSQALSRYKMRGVLPQSTTVHEFVQLRDLTITTTPEEALAALEEIRATKSITGESEPSSNAEEFERRRQELLAQLASGGVDVEEKSSKPSAPVPEALETEHRTLQATKLPIGANSLSNGSRSHEMPSASKDASLNEQSSSGTPSHSVSASQTSPTPIESARRNKLDLGAGRRMLFGALGFKAPKTKTEEEKIRSEFSKFIRPENPPSEVKSIAEAVLVADDDDSWREKIKYRAVECVQEGIELSEPPFPFMQRWDPQQRNSSRRGKQKNLHRDQTRYYDDDSRTSGKQRRQGGVYSYAEDQEYLDASYQPSHQDDSVFNSYDDVVQYESGRQLQKNTQDNRASPELDDLPPVPDNLSDLDKLEAGGAKVGMTIVFKQLDCSAATKWQPQMTDFRTAIVIAITDSGDLQLSLAKRDRKQYEFDEETGERLFDKFDMPLGDGLDEEDNGMLSLSFNELYEPKIVQEAPADLYHDAVMQDDIGSSHDRAVPNAIEPNLGTENQEAQFSHVTETTLHSDALEPRPQDEAMQGMAALDTPEDAEEALGDEGQDQFHETLPQSPLEFTNVSSEGLSTPPFPPFPPLETDTKSNSVSPVLQGAEAEVEPFPEPISDETRRSISHMIKDAGFRSSIPSSILKNLQSNGTQSPGDDAVFEKLMRDMAETGSSAPYSPKFNGLGSSSPIKRHDAWDAVNASQIDRSVSPVQIQSSWVTIEGDIPSSSAKNSQAEQPEELDSPNWMTESEEEPSNSPALNSIKRNVNKQRRPNKTPVGKAQALWAQFQQKKENEQLNTHDGKSLSSPEDDSNGNHESGAPISVEYPKLSVGSSFTSQITDHGHQPDFSFDTDTHIASDLACDTALSDAILSAESGIAHPDSHGGVENEPFLKKEHLEREAALAAQEIPTSARIDALLNSPSKRLPVSHRESSSSSDDSFPPLEQVFSQKSMKIERTTPVNKIIPSKDNRKYQRAMAMADEDSEDSNQSTPKQSQKHSYHEDKQAPENFVSASRTIKVRDSQPPASQASEPPQLSQASMVVDLTMSSDAEPQPVAEESEDSEPFKAFKRYDHDFEDDAGNDRKKGGWTRKKSGGIAGIEEGRKTSTGLRAPSQSSLNSYKRRKISPRS